MKKNMEYMDTKEKILMTASDIFAKHGYKDTTIRMIATEADTNVASINYYFGDKGKLYLEVIKYWSDDAFKEYPFEELEDTSKNPEYRLRTFVYNTLLCLLGSEGKGTGFGRLITWEASHSPSEVVHQVIAESIGKPTQSLFKIVQEITGCDEAQSKKYAASIIGQTTYFYLSRYLINDLYGIKDVKSKMDIEMITDMIVSFSLHALNNETLPK